MRSGNINKGGFAFRDFLILGAVEGSKVNINLFGAEYSCDHYNNIALQNLTNYEF